MISRERLQERFLEMIQVHSPSKKEKDMCQWLMSYFAEKGIAVSIDHAGESYGGNGGNVVAHIPGTGEGMPLCFAAHTDQIEPCDKIKAIVDGDIIRTDGTTTLGGDDKGGIAAILEALEDILETKTPHREMYLVFTATEEMSMLGAKFMDMTKVPCLDMVVADATGPTGIIAYKAPAMESMTCTFYGKKAHAGIEPEKGINAIVVAGKAIAKMHMSRIDEETTANIGRIEGGGATNVVTDEVHFTAEIRSHSMAKLAKEIEYMEVCCKEAAESMGAAYKMEHELAYPSFELDLESSLYQLTKASMEAEGITPEAVVIGGGSDANIFAAKGYRSAILSVGMNQVHTVEEFLDMKELMKVTKVIRRMMMI